MKTKEKTKAEFTAKELNELFGSRYEFKEKKQISTDSREVKNGDIFIPLKGEKFDGHQFIEKIIKENPETIVLSEKNKAKETKILEVKSTLEAYHKLANKYLNKIKPKVVAITGSSGKTTTKEILAAVLSEKYRVHKTEKNYNNEFGVPKTILEMPEDTEVLVLELAMRGRGEIEQLSRICEPDISVINNIGTAHIGRLGSVEEIARAKLEILEHAKKDSIFIYNENKILEEEMKRKKITIKKNKYSIRQAKNITYVNGKTQFNFQENKYEINALGSIYVLNTIAAILISKELDMNEKEISNGLKEFKMPEGRGTIIKIGNNKFLVDESYNANPDSVKEAIRNLSECWDEEFEKVVILGEMAELGNHSKRLLNELNEWIKEKKDINVITIGDKLRELNIGDNIKDKSHCCDILKEKIAKEGKIVILVKGSRVAQMDEIVKRVIQWKEKK